MNQNTQPKRGRGRPRKYPKPEAVKPEVPAENGVLTLPATPTPQPAYNNGVLTIPDPKQFAAEVSAAMRREIADATAAVVDVLRRELPIVARIAAADVMHSSMPAEIVFGNAIKEGQMAADVWVRREEARK